MKILQVADTHFGTENDAVCAALTRFVRVQQPDLLLLCGDVTQRATRRQFARARAFLDALALPRMLVVPGNHDIPLWHLGLRLVAPYRRYRAAFGRALEGAVEHADARVVSVNTTRRLRHVDGEIDATHVARVARAFADASATQWRLVVVHQPVAVTRSGECHNLLHGAEDAVRRWAQAGVDLVLGGHIHLPFVLALTDAWPGLAQPMWAVQAGTATSTRVRPGAPNSVNLLTLEGHVGARRAEILRCDYDATLDAFDGVKSHLLEKH